MLNSTKNIRKERKIKGSVYPRYNCFSFSLYKCLLWTTLGANMNCGWAGICLHRLGGLWVLSPKPQHSPLPQTFISVRWWRDPAELLLFPLGAGGRMHAQDSTRKLVLLKLVLQQLLEFRFSYWIQGCALQSQQPGTCHRSGVTGVNCWSEESNCSSCTSTGCSLLL